MPIGTSLQKVGVSKAQSRVCARYLNTVLLTY